MVVVGVDHADMAAAATRLREIGRGQVAVSGGEVLGEIASRSEVCSRTDRSRTWPRRSTISRKPPMSFLALSVVPELKLTDRSLVDVERFEIVPLEV